MQEQLSQCCIRLICVCTSLIYFCISCIRKNSLENLKYSLENLSVIYRFPCAYLPGKPKPWGCGALSGVPKKEASASLSSSLNTMKLGFFSVQGAHVPPFGPLGSLYFTKLLHAVSIFSERSQSPLVQGRQQCFSDLKTNQRSEEWKAPFRRCVTSG